MLGLWCIVVSGWVGTPLDAQQLPEAEVSAANGDAGAEVPEAVELQEDELVLRVFPQYVMLVSHHPTVLADRFKISRAGVPAAEEVQAGAGWEPRRLGIGRLLLLPVSPGEAVVHHFGID